MKKSVLISLLFLSLVASAAAFDETGQATTPTNTVSIHAKGDDVRSTLSDMFAQTKKNFVLAPGVRFVLYLSLDKVDFDEALEIICQQANLKVEIQNGIYYISLRPAKAVDTSKTGAKATDTKAPKSTTETTVPKIEAVKSPAKVEPTVTVKAAPIPSVLQKRVTTRLQKADIRVVFAELSKQTGVKIEVDASVPAYKLDAFLLRTSLRYALDQVSAAAKLLYRFTDSNTIQIYRPAEQGRITLSNP